MHVKRPYARPAPPRRELWLEGARRAFAALAGGEGAGTLKLDAILGALRSKLPADEVDYAVEDALVEAGYAGEEFVCLPVCLIVCVCVC